MLVVETTGNGSFDTYSHNLVEELKKVGSIDVLQSSIYGSSIRNFGVSWLSWTAARVVRDNGNFVRVLRDVLRESGNDAIHLTNHHLARYGPELGVPYVVTIHDTIRFMDMWNTQMYDEFDYYASHPNARDRHYLQRDIDGIKGATQVIAVSEHTKNDIVRWIGVPPHHVTVIHEAVDRDVFQPNVVNRFFVGGKMLTDYILFVGTEYPRKNFAKVVEAISILKFEYNDLGNTKLVKVGRSGGKGTELRDESKRLVKLFGVESEVIFLDYVSEPSIVSLYNNAKALVMPSFYEGFGFPVLEAMACNCPVIASNSTSLVEIVGDGGWQVDPYDERDIAGAIRELIVHDTWSARLRVAGRKQVDKFSWQRAAKETQKVYDVVEKGGHED